MTEANKKFYGSFFTIVVPIALQQLISSALSVADTLMLGYVSQTALASSSLAGQIQFVLNMIFMGLAAGITILAAQYWGKGNLSAVEKVFSIGLKLSFSALKFSWTFSRTPERRFIRSSFGGSVLFNLYILDAVFKYHVDKLIARIVAFARDFIKTLQNIFPNTHGNDSVPVLSALFNLQRFIFHKFHLTIYTNYRLTAEL